MEISIKPQAESRFPLKGILIKGTSVLTWLKTIEKMGLEDEDSLEAYAIPSNKANEIWGCFLKSTKSLKEVEISQHQFCQEAHPSLFIPECSDLFPPISMQEINELCNNNTYVLHPEFGCVELEEKLDWSTLITLPEAKAANIQISDLFPTPLSMVNGFHVISLNNEDALDELEKSVVQEKETFKDEPLNFLERMKLFAYKNLFKQKESTEKKGEKELVVPSILDKISSFLGLDKIGEKALKNDFKNLEERNKKELEKLLSLFKDNPEEALKYAIPLDSEGISRGQSSDSYQFSRQWGNFSLFQNRGGASGGVNIIGESEYDRLQRQYREAAEKFEAQGDYRKAAFVYINLLKNYHLAIQVLEKGKLYKEAGKIYLEKLKNKKQAAECYERGFLFEDAIELYKELREDEKVGDLLIALGREEEAFGFYEKIAQQRIESNQYVKAALIYKKKMGDASKGQACLLKGWENNIDAYNCLNNYFNNISEEELLLREVKRIYKEDISDKNYDAYLQLLQHEYKKRTGLREELKPIAYELIANYVEKNRFIVNELPKFNLADKEISKEVTRFSTHYKYKRKKGS